MMKTCSAHHGPPKSSLNSAQIVAKAFTSAGATGNPLDNVALEATTTSAKKV
jgi:hypothetical protein